MSEKILVPALGESITEATVVKWLKNKGESVETDEPIVELETDKVNLEVPSPMDGILSEINAKDGQVVEVGALLGSISNGKSEIKKENNKQNKETKKYIGVRIHDDECPCEGDEDDDECWYYVKYLNEFKNLKKQQDIFDWLQEIQHGNHHSFLCY